MTTRFDQLTWRTQFTSAESVVIERGLTPRSSDDKWAVTFERDTILFRRSWTGFLIYKVHVRQVASGGLEVTSVEVSADPTQYTRGTDAYERAFLNWLIRELMLGQDVEMPIPDELRPTWRQRIQDALEFIANAFRRPSSPSPSEAEPSEAEVEGRQLRYMSIARAHLQSRHGEHWVPRFLFTITDPDGDYYTTMRADGGMLIDSPGDVFVFSDSRESVILDPLIDALGSFAQSGGSPEVLAAFSIDASDQVPIETVSLVVRHSLSRAGALGDQPVPPAPSPAALREYVARLLARRPDASPARERFAAMIPFLGLVFPFDAISDYIGGMIQFAWVDGSLRGRDAVVVTVYARSRAITIQAEVVRGFGMGRRGVPIYNRARVVTDAEYADLDEVMGARRFSSMPLESKSGALDGSFWLLQALSDAGVHVVIRNSPRVDNDAGFREICAKLVALANIPEQHERGIFG